ncbi:MAG TPA: aldo/keto reductase [Deltaproteobacteria bacterium]|nr:aldo/keto reductase [Deltaproteobacteria bacterium]
MDHVVGMDLSTWQGMRSRDPRRLTLGSAQWGMPYGIANRAGMPDAQELEAILAKAREAGIGSIDTARAYGESETRIGRAMADSRDWRVITKLDPDAHRPGLGIAETLERVARSLDASRRALGLDVLPVLLLHRFPHRHACGGRLWRRLLAERDAGRIGALGASAATPEEAWAALEDPDIEVLQVASSLLDLRLHRQGFFPRARELGRTIHVRSVFLQGLAHVDPERLPASLAGLAEPLRMIRAFASKIGVPARALYLAFVRELPGVHPVLGCETADQLADLLTDWQSESVEPAMLTRLVEALPTLDADLVDPSRWNSPRIDWNANQTGSASVATMPT